MRYYQGRSMRSRPLELANNGPAGGNVNIRKRFIQKQYAMVSKKGQKKACALQFATGQ